MQHECQLLYIIVILIRILTLHGVYDLIMSIGNIVDSITVHSICNVGYLSEISHDLDFPTAWKVSPTNVPHLHGYT